MPQKILVTGTLRAGKTTLMTALAQRSDTVIVREVAQDFIDQYGYLVTQRPEFQDMVFAEQLRREDEAMKMGKEYVLCDRGTVDILGFCKVIGHPIKSSWAESIRDRYNGITIFNKDDIHFETGEYPPEMRNQMRVYRDQVDQSIRAVLAEFQLTAIEIQGTHSERLQLFNEYLHHSQLKENLNPRSAEGSRYLPLGLRKER